MVLVYSATKGMAAHGHWRSPTRAAGSTTTSGSPRTGPSSPRPARSGPPSASCSAHQAGLFGFDEPVDRAVIADPTASPGSWPASARPGSPASGRPTTPSASASTRARSSGASTRSTGPSAGCSPRRSPRPLGLEFYIRLPESMPDSRLAPLVQPARSAMLAGLPPRMLLDAMNPRSVLFRSLMSNPGHAGARRPRADLSPASSRSRRGAASARPGRSRRPTACSPRDGHELGLRAETLAALRAPAVPPTRGFHDECLQGRGAVLARLHEAHAHLAIRSSGSLRRSRGRWLARVCRPVDGHRLRLRDEPDRHQAGRRSPRRRAPPGHAAARGRRLLTATRSTP